ncbi:MAG TPA: DUF2231 domain-containing protein [Gammaproteobacteria bacterium]
MKPLRVQGIPIHPVLVHFPIAGWTAASLLALATTATANEAFATAALYCNAVALVTGLGAIAAGFLEFLALPEEQAVRDAAARHMLLAGSAWFLYLVMLLLQVKSLFVSASVAGGIAFIVLLLAGHAGARLVYHHHLPAPFHHPS